EAGDVRPDAVLLEHPDIFREGFETPIDAGAQRLERHALDVGEVAHGEVTIRRPAWRKREAAVAHHHRGDPERGRRIGKRIPGNLRVVVSMGVDDSRHQRQPVCIDALGSVTLHLADFGYPAVLYGDASYSRRAAQAVVN